MGPGYKRWLREHAEAGRLAKSRFKHLQRTHGSRENLRAAYNEMWYHGLAVFNFLNAQKYGWKANRNGVPRSSNW
jgi:hypothetical protein